MTMPDPRRLETPTPGSVATVPPTSATPAESYRAPVQRPAPLTQNGEAAPPFRRPVPSASEWPPALPDSPRALFEAEANDDTSAEPPVIPEVPRGFSPEDALNGQLHDLEAWATSLHDQQRARALRFWLSRGAAFATATLGLVLGLLGFASALTVAAAGCAVSLAFVAVFRPDGNDRPYRRAVADLRDLQHSVKLRWDKIRLLHPDSRSRKRIAHTLALLEAIQSKREEIGSYLGSAEPTSGLSPRR